MHDGGKKKEDYVLRLRFAKVTKVFLGQNFCELVTMPRPPKEEFFEWR